MVGLRRCIVAFSVVYLTFTIFAFHADASNNFCAAAMDKELCENTVKGASDWNEAITMAVTEAMNQVVKATKSGNSECEKFYKDTEEKLMESMESIRKGDKNGSLDIELAAAITSLEECTNALKDLKEDASTAQTLNHGIEQAIRVCLAVDETSKSGANSSKSATSNKRSYTILS